MERTGTAVVALRADADTVCALVPSCMPMPWPTLNASSLDVIARYCAALLIYCQVVWSSGNPRTILNSARTFAPPDYPVQKDYAINDFNGDYAWVPLVQTGRLMSKQRFLSVPRTFSDP